MKTEIFNPEKSNKERKPSNEEKKFLSALDTLIREKGMDPKNKQLKELQKKVFAAHKKNLESPENETDPELEKVRQALGKGSTAEAEALINQAYEKSVYNPKNESKEAKEKRLLNNLEEELAKDENKQNKNKIKKLQQQLHKDVVAPENKEKTEQKVEPVIPAEPVEPPKEPELEPEVKEPEVKKSEIELLVQDEIDTLKLESILTKEFGELTNEQKLFALKNLKQRIFDIVKEDAQTQYSKYFKEQTIVEAQSAKTFDKLSAKIKSAGKGIWETGKKEFVLKDLESQAFQDLMNSETGKKLVAEALDQLVETTKEKNIYLNKENQPQISFAEQLKLPNNLSEEEKRVILEYNHAANAFRALPHEWGKEKSGKRKREYEWVKKAYDEVTTKVTALRLEKIEEKKKDKIEQKQEQIVTEMLLLKSGVELDQLLNTHPEFEKQFTDLARESNRKQETVSTVKSFLHNMVGKSKSTKLIFAGGFFGRAGVRMATAGLTTAGSMAATGVSLGAAPIVGATIGWYRGKARGREQLTERQKKARHGKKDTGPGKLATSEVTRLVKRLEDLVSEIETLEKEKVPGASNLDYSQALAKLEVAIGHTQGKIEKGEVNFGNARELLKNKMALTEVVNKALIIKHSEQKEINTKILAQINSLLEHTGRGINERMEIEKNKFLRQQAKRGALIGAGAATAGYAVRWAGEQMGWWGHAGEHVRESLSPIHYDMPSADKMAGARFAGKIMTQHPSPSANLGDSHEKLVGNMHQKFDDAGAKVDHPVGKPETSGTSSPPGKIKIGGVEVKASTGQEVKNDFAVTLGKGGAPRNLETAYNEISASYMDLPKGGSVNAEFATKSLNMVANLVELTRGHGVAGINAEEFGKAVSFKDGILKVKDHVQFNEILSKLKGHSDEAWSKGILQSKGAAGDYIKNIGSKSWLKIVHGDGLHESATGVNTGVAGHQDVTLEKINDFGHGGGAVAQEVGGAGKSGAYVIDQNIANNQTPLGGAPSGEGPAEAGNGSGVGGGVIDQTIANSQRPLGGDLPGKDTSAGQNLANKNILGNQAETPKGVRLTENWGVNHNLTHEQLYNADQTYKSNLSKLFPTKRGMRFWNSLKDVKGRLSADKLMELKSDDDPRYKPVVDLFNKIRAATGIVPIKENAVLGVQPETPGEYLLRATEEAARTGKLDQIQL